MVTRRKFIAAALVSPVVPLGSVMAQAVKKEEAKQADFLFVQTAKGMTFDKSTNKLTLDGISSTTLFFSDRPERIAGNMKTTAFVPFWSTGKDSFLKDPPNADVSILEGDKLRQIVVVLQAPELKSDNLIYTGCCRATCRRRARTCRYSSTSLACPGRLIRTRVSRGAATGECTGVSAFICAHRGKSNLTPF